MSLRKLRLLNGIVMSTQVKPHLESWYTNSAANPINKAGNIPAENSVLLKC